MALPYLRCLGISLLVTVLSSKPAMANPQADQYKPSALAKISLSPSRTELRQLRDKGYDIAGFNLKTGTADVFLTADRDTLSLLSEGFTVKSIESIDATLAPDSEYKTPTEVYEILQDWARNYPGLAHLESLGKSLKGEEIWALRISNDAAVRDAKPAVLFNAEHHAREVMTVEVVLDTAEYLLTRYGSDPRVTSWVDRNNIWLMPMVNPDGSNMVWKTNNMWRKNARGNYGVDINRNYPFMWSGCGGSSSMPWAQDFHGASAASEPETQVMMKLVERIKPVFNISFHSYSEIVIYPYGCDGRYAEDRGLVESIGKQMADMIPSETGQGSYTPGTAWELLYDVDGSDIDWMYHDHHVLAYCIEVSSDQSGFQPPFSQRQSTVESIRPAWQHLLDRLEQSGIHGVVRDNRGRPLANASISIQSLSSLSSAPGTWTTDRQGRFHAILAPGTYNVRISVGPLTGDRTVKVDDKVVTSDFQI